MSASAAKHIQGIYQLAFRYGNSAQIQADIGPLAFSLLHLPLNPSNGCNSSITGSGLNLMDSWSRARDNSVISISMDYDDLFSRRGSSSTAVSDAEPENTEEAETEETIDSVWPVSALDLGRCASFAAMSSRRSEIVWESEHEKELETEKLFGVFERMSLSRYRGGSFDSDDDCKDPLEV